jgi:hypothetical protein
VQRHALSGHRSAAIDVGKGKGGKTARSEKTKKQGLLVKPVDALRQSMHRQMQRMAVNNQAESAWSLSLCQR